MASPRLSLTRRPTPFGRLKTTASRERSTISCIETPQVFPYARILELHEGGGEVDKNSNAPPDDTTLFTRAAETVRVVFHEGSNLKVTYPEDIAAAEGVLFQRGWQDVTEGED